MHIRSPLLKFAAFFGAQDAPERREHEIDRDRQRIVVCVGILLVAAADRYLDELSRPRELLAAVAGVYLAASLAYFLLLRRGRVQSVVPLYAYLVLDPLFLSLALYLDPYKFAFFNPFLLVVIVRSGLRYGIRTMYLSWTATLLGAALLLTSEFWRDEIELTLAYFFLLAWVPTLFASLVRRIHGVRTVEEERARLLAKDEAIIARSSFLARVSHELRSPLQGIVSALDVLAMRRGPAASADDELIQRIRRSSLLLNTHLRDLLTLAKGDAGRLDLRPEPFDAPALVESVAASAIDLARSKQLELVVDVPEGAVFVVADGARIDQILTNLVINSIRYTERGQVRLALQPYDPRERRLEFVVADTGPGIPQAMLPTLLTPDKAITGPARRGEGSGIGLAIVRTLVDHLGGHVEVASRIGEGTTFTVSIPAEPVEADERDTIPGSATGRVLIVDDDDDIVVALASVVDELGFECDRASSAAVAANLLASRSYDAVFLDVEMPVRGGAELAEETRRGGGPNDSTRFVGMSAAEAGEEVRKRFDVWLPKPIDHGALRQALLGPGREPRPSQPGLWSSDG